MLVLFRDDYNAARNSVVRSNAATIGEAGDVSIVSTVPADAQVAFVRNGVNVGSGPVSVQVGDTLAVETRASSNYMDAVQVEMAFNLETMYYALVTAGDSTLYVNPDMAGLDPFAIEHDEYGFGFNPTTASNVLLQYGSSGEVLASVSLRNALTTTFVAEPSHLLVPSFYDRQVHIVNTSTRTRVGSIKTFGSPRDAKWVPRADGSGIQDIWVASYSANSLEVYSASGELLVVHYVGNKPCGIAFDGTAVYATCSESNMVMVFTSMSGEWFPNVAMTDDTPTDIVAFNGRAFASCTGGTNVCVIDSSANVTSIYVGNNPRGLAVVGDKLHVTLTSGDVVVINSAGTVESSYRTGSTANAVASYNGEAYVAALSLGRLYRGSVNIAETGQWPYFLYGTADGLWCATMWKTNPSLLYKHVNDPHPFVIDVPSEVERDVALRTNTWQVVGINSQAYVNVVGSNAVIYRNGLASGQSAVVNAGDELYMTLTSPDEAETEFSARIFVGGENNVYITGTRALDTQPTFIAFEPVFDAELGSEHTSNQVIVSGLDDGVEVTASINAGKFIVNGAETLSISVQVQNGDTLAIKNTASNANNVPVFATMTLGDQSAVFAIFTKNSDGQVYLQRYRDAGKSIFDLIDFPPAVVNDLHNNMLVLDRANFTPTATYSLLATPSNSPRTDQPNAYALDVKRRRAILVDIPGRFSNASGVSKVYQLPGLPAGIAAGPSVAIDSVTTKTYITMYDLDAIQELDGPAIPIRTGVKPLGIAVDNYNTMYVACVNGLLATMEYREDLASYRYKSIISLPGAGRLNEILIDDTNLYVTDLTYGTVHRMNSGLYAETIKVGLLPYSMTASETTVYVANFGDATITYFPKVGGSVNPRTIPLPDSGSQPNAILYDQATNRVYVSCVRTGRIYVLNAANNQFVDSYPSNYTWGLGLYEDKLLGVTLYGNLLQSLSVGVPRTPVSALNFPALTNLELETEVTSAQRAVNDIPQHEWIYIDPLADTRLIVNNVAVGHSARVSEFDTVRIESVSPNEYFKRRAVGLYSYRYHTTFDIETTLDVYPNDLTFATVQDVLPRSEVKSDTQVISGLDPTVSVPIRAEYSGSEEQADLKLFVNDVEVTQPHSVVNGDEIRIELHAYGLVFDGNAVYVELLTDRNSVFGLWRIVSAYTNGAVVPPYKIGELDGMGVDPSVTEQYGAEVDGLGVQIGYTAGTTASIDQTFERQLPEDRLIDITVEGKTVTAYSREIEALVPQRSEYAALTVNGMGSDSSAARAQVLFEGATSIAAKTWSSAEISIVYGWGATRRGHAEASDVVEWSQALRSKTKATSPIGWSQRIRPVDGLVSPSYASTLVRARYATDTAWDRSVINAHAVDAEYLVADRNNMYVKPSWGWNDSQNKASVDSVAEAVKQGLHKPVETSWSDIVQPLDREYVPLWDFAAGDSTSLFAATALQLKRAVMRHVTANYAQSMDRSRHEVGAEYLGRVITTGRLFDAMAERRKRAVNRTVDQSYDITKRVTWDLYEYTAEDIRAFSTPSAAINAGEEADYPVVAAFPIYSDLWMWTVPATIERVQCAAKSNEVNYVWGYIQGG